ncbi:MAG: glycosyltransferase family 4 protein [Acidobacteriota bacterium]|nr:glycosyltransferase family 4 protein [Acidobacteriota bacterium]
MKVLYVITRAERGGAQVHLLDLIASLQGKVQALIATGERGFLCNEAARMGVPVHIIPNLTQPIRPLKDGRALLELISLIRRESPDLVHAHTSKAGLIARLAGRLTRVPTVFTAHTWSFADGVPCRQKLLAVPLERLAASFGGRIITVSEANRALALRRKIAADRCLVGVWNGVPDVPQQAAPGKSDVVTVTMVARFAPQKDHLTLVKAMTGVRGNWRLLFVGDGPLRPQVEAEVKASGLSQRIECLGDRADIAEILKKTDIFVLATRWEGLPLSILEAMRAGVPVIATDVGGVAEAVTDGVTGYLTRCGDIEQLRDCLNRLVGSPELMGTMGRAARRRYEKDFNVETMASRTLAVYRATNDTVDLTFAKSVIQWRSEK